MRRILATANVALLGFHCFALWTLATTFAAGLVWWAGILTVLGPLVALVALLCSIPAPRSRSGLIINVLVTAAYISIWVPPLLRYSQDLSVAVVQVVPSEEALVVDERWEDLLEANEISVLRSSFSTGTLRQGAQSWLGTGVDRNQARILIVVTGPISSELRFRIPKATAIVYVQDGEEWRMYPPNAALLEDTIGLLPSTGSGGPRLALWETDRPR